METIENLEQQLRQCKSTQEQIHTYLCFATQPYRYGVNQCMDICEKAENLARQLKDTPTIIKSFLAYMKVYAYAGNYDLVQTYFDKGILLADQIADPLSYAALYHAIAESLWYQGAYKQAEESALKALNYAQDGQASPTKLGGLYNLLAAIQNAQKDYANAIENFRKVIQIAQAENNHSLQANACNWLGMIYDDLGDYEEALQYQHESVRIGELIHHDAVISQAFNCIGLLHFEKGNVQLAEDYYRKSLALREKINDKRGMADNYHNLAMLFRDRDQHEQALQFLQKALDLRQGVNHQLYQAHAYYCMGEVYFKMNQSPQARHYLQQANTIYTQENSTKELVGVAIQMAQCYLTENNLSEAWSHLQIAQERLSSGHNELLHQFNQVLARYHALQDNYQAAYELSVKNAEIQEQLFQEKTQQIFANTQVRYEVEKREKEAELAKTQAQIAHLQNVELHEANERLQETNAKYAQATRKLEEMNHTKDKFFSILSHDLRSPFTILLGMSRMLIESFDQLDKEEIQTELRHIHQSAKNYYKLLENLLTWSRLQLGKIEPKISLFPIEPMIREIVELFALQAQHKKIQLEIVVPSPIELLADFNMIFTCIRNLISNALKFTEDGLIRIEGQESEDKIILHIRDTGIGIAQNQVETLFLPGQAISTYGTRHEPGTGLGLLLCKELLDLNDASIHVDSLENQGTTVTLTFPHPIRG